MSALCPQDSPLLDGTASKDCISMVLVMPGSASKMSATRGRRSLTTVRTESASYSEMSKPGRTNATRASRSCPNSPGISVFLMNSERGRRDYGAATVSCSLPTRTLESLTWTAGSFSTTAGSDSGHQSPSPAMAASGQLTARREDLSC